MAMAPSTPVTGPRIFLGLFILGQLFFLFASNFLGFILEYKDDFRERWQAPIERLAPGFTKHEGHVWEMTQTLTRLTKMWDHATGQNQNWCLFAPGISDESTFLALELHWEDAPESAPAIARSLSLLATGTPLEAAALTGLALNQGKLWLSDNEPTNIEKFFRLGNFRIRRFENNLALDLVPKEEETPEETAQRWREKIQKYLKDSDYGYLVRPYMEWRLRQIQRKTREETQPRQLILLMRRYQINDPKEGTQPWQGPHSNPVARWQPGVDRGDQYLPLEMFNPVTKRFESVLK